MIYQYRCVNCGRIIELTTNASDKLRPSITCDCGGEMRKLLNAVPVHYKGSGFYSTDYKKDK